MESIIQRWNEWYRAFEQCALDGQWDRLAPFLTEDAQYRVSGMPYACTLKGRSAIIDGFRKSFEGFDWKFDRREHHVVGTRFSSPGMFRHGFGADMKRTAIQS